jgi:glycosyltransferase involved in cell wall biosynthesis
MNRFHSASSGIMVATESIAREIEARGFHPIRKWSRGVDTALFHPQEKDFLPDRRPIYLYVGRVAVEKNLAAFLDLPLDGTKYVVGTGPQLEELKKAYPDVRFPGRKYGDDLARYYAAADVFVFPSLTDTFGIVMLEALASGVPVAAFPVPGPIDVIGPHQVGIAEHPVGALDADLKTAIDRALTCRPEDCRAFALGQSWDNCVRLFLDNIVPVPEDAWAHIAEAPAGTAA